MDVFPPRAAKWSRLNPLLPFKDGSAPFCISISKASCLSLKAAVISGVAATLFLESTSKPSDNSLLIMDVFPPCAAKWSGLDPSLDVAATLCPRMTIVKINLNAGEKYIGYYFTLKTTKFLL